MTAVAIRPHVHQPPAQQAVDSDATLPRVVVRPREPHPDLRAELVICAEDVCTLAQLISIGTDRFRLTLDEGAVLAGMAGSQDWHFRAQQFAERGHQVEVWAGDVPICTLGAVSIPAEDARRSFSLTGTTYARASSHPAAEQLLQGPSATPTH